MTPLCFAGSVPAAIEEKGQGRESFCEARCPCLVCTPRTPDPERASFLQLLRQQAMPRAQGREWGGRDRNCPWVSQLQGSRELGRPCLGKRLPQNVQFQEMEDIFQSLKTYCSPQLFYYQDHCQGNTRILIPLVSSPCRGWHPGARCSRPCLPLGHNPFLHRSLSFSPSPPLYPSAPTQTVCTGSLPL